MSTKDFRQRMIARLVLMTVLSFCIAQVGKADQSDKSNATKNSTEKSAQKHNPIRKKTEFRRSIHNTGETLSPLGLEVGTFGAYLGLSNFAMIGVVPNLAYFTPDTDALAVEASFKFENDERDLRATVSLSCGVGCKTLLNSDSKSETFAQAKMTGGMYVNEDKSLSVSGFVAVIDGGNQVVSQYSSGEVSSEIRERKIIPDFGFDVTKYYLDSDSFYVGINKILYAGYTWNFSYIRVGIMGFMSLLPILPYAAVRADFLPYAAVRAD